MVQAAELPAHRFSRAEYDRMVALGALEGLPVELLDGVIVEVSPQGHEHMAMIQVLTALLAPLASEGRLRVQGPLAASEWSEPEPDLAVVEAFVPGAHPATAQLAIEVAVSAHAAARRKAAIYAAAAVAELWVVDVPARVVEVHDAPSAGAYRRHRVLRGEEELAVPSLDVATTVNALFTRAGLA